MAQGLQMPPIQSTEKLVRLGSVGKEHTQGLGMKEQGLDDILDRRPHVIFCWCESKVLVSIYIRELYKNFGAMLERKNNETEI